MCPEYGATVAIFPIDDMTLDYLRLTGRDESQRAAGRGVRARTGTVPARRRARRGLLQTRSSCSLASVEPSLAGPEAAAGSRVADECESGVPGGAADDAGRAEDGQG